MPNELAQQGRVFSKPSAQSSGPVVFVLLGQQPLHKVHGVLCALRVLHKRLARCTQVRALHALARAFQLVW